MIAVAPLIPTFGTTPTLYYAAALGVGIAFGFFLERAGFGSAKTLTAVFTMRNWQVYRVMFTALVTALIGSQVLSGIGVLDLSLVEVGPTYLLAMAVGGILFGVGFYFGGFCPGTAVVSAVRGRLDAVVFLVGLMFGIFGFAIFFDGAGQATWFQSFYQPAGAQVMRLSGAVPVWLMAIIVTVGVLTSFKFVYLLEQRFALMTPEQLGSGQRRPPVVRPLVTRAARVGIAVVGVLLVVLAVVQPGGSESIAIAADTSRLTAVDEGATIDPLSVVGWVVSDAHRKVDEKPANSFLIDLRRVDERADAPTRGSIEVTSASSPVATADEVLAALESLEAADRNKPVVVLGSSDAVGLPGVVAQLRQAGVNALLVAGGSDAWRSTVSDPADDWPSVGVDVRMAAYQDDVSAWLSGRTEDVPSYLPIPGTQQLPGEVAAAVATGSGGGGCG